MSNTRCIIVGAKDSVLVKQQLAALPANQFAIYEGDEDAFGALQEAFGKSQRVTLHKKFVSPDGKESTYYQLNDASFSALLKPSGLLELFPNLKQIQKKQVTTVSITDLVKTHCSDSSKHTLIINDFAQAYRLISAIVNEGQLESFEQLELTSTIEPLYNDGASMKELGSLLSGEYFNIAPSVLGNQDPDFPSVSAKKDIQARENKQLKQQLANLTAKLKAQEDLSNAITQKLDSLQQSMSELSEQTVSRMTNAVTAAMRSSNTQIETHLRLRAQWSAHGLRGDPCQYKLASELASYLIEKTAEEYFDVVLEFGVSDSTRLIQNVLTYEALTGRHSTNEKSPEHQVANSTGQTRFFSWDNRSTDVERVTSEIADGEKDRLQVKQTPLIDFEYDGKTYLHYDCDADLQQLKNQLGNQRAKILVLVNGPHHELCEQAVFPAAVKVLNHLSQHEIHLVLPDYKTEQNKKAAARWSQLIVKRELSLEKQLLPFLNPGFSWVINT